MPHLVELQSLDDVDAWLAATPPRSLSRVAVQGVDLRQRSSALATREVNHALFLGCQLTEEGEADLRRRGALVFPAMPSVPFHPYRASLYTPEELYTGLDEAYSRTPDAMVYAWQQRPAAKALASTLAMSLHDHAIEDALAELDSTLAPANTLGIMGGHAATRGSDSYRASAHLAAKLTAGGLTVLTGGGPGAMEAANLGAALVRNGQADHSRIDEAVNHLARVPSFRPRGDGGQGITAWARAAFEVRETFGAAGTSIGVPTWFYGHEPPNPFASHIAKFFSNALREDTLLAHCRRGLIYLEGAAGTVQEIFQAATGNYYAAGDTRPSPMVLVGIDHWTKALPAWPLLQALGKDRAMGDHIHLVDSIEEAAALLVEKPAV